MSLAPDPHEVHRVGALQDSQLYDVTGALEELLHVRPRGADDLILAQCDTAKLEEAKSQAVPIRRRFDEPGVAKFGHDPMDGGLGQASAASHETQ